MNGIWSLLLFVPPLYLLLEGPRYGVSLPTDPFFSEWANCGVLFSIIRILISAFVFFTFWGSCLLILSYRRFFLRRLFYASFPQILLTFFGVTLYTILFSFFIATEPTQSNQVARKWSELLFLAAVSGPFHWTIFLQFYFFIFPKYIKAQQQVRFCEKVRIVYSDSSNEPKVENWSGTHSSENSKPASSPSLSLARELSQNKIFDGYDVQLTTMREFSSLGLVGSGGDTRILDGEEGENGICLLLFILDQSQAVFENGVCRWLQGETNSRIFEGTHVGYEKNIVYTAEGQRRIDLNRLKYSIFGFNSSLAPSSLADEGTFIHDWLDDVGLFSLTRAFLRAREWPSQESDQSRKSRFTEWVGFLEQSMKKFVVNPRSPTSRPLSESDPYLIDEVLTWALSPPGLGREVLKIRNRPHELDVHSSHLFLFAVFSSYRWFYLRTQISNWGESVFGFVSPIFNLPFIPKFFFFLLFVFTVAVNLLDATQIISIDFPETIDFNNIPLGIFFAIRILFTIGLTWTYVFLVELNILGYFCDSCRAGVPHDHSDPNSSSSDIVEDDAEELQDDGPLTDFATFYPTISPLPPSLSPKYEGKYDLEMEGEKAWPTKGEVESELDKRFVNNTYAYQIKPSLGFSRFYSHEVALRDFRETSVAWTSDPATGAIYFFGSSMQDGQTEEEQEEEKEKLSVFEDDPREVARNVDLVLSKLQSGKPIPLELRSLLSWKVWRRLLQTPILLSPKLEDQLHKRWDDIVLNTQKEIQENGLILMPDDLFPPVIISALQDAYFRVLEEYSGPEGLTQPFVTWNEEPIGRYLNHQMTPFMRRIVGDKILHPGLTLAIWNGGKGFPFHTDTIPPFDITLDIMVLHQGPHLRPIYFLVRDKNHRTIPRVAKVELDKPGSSALFIGSHLPHFGGDLPKGCTQAVLLLTWSFVED